MKQAAQSIDQAKPQPTEENIAKASIDVAKVRAHSSETALKASSKLIELAGSRGSQRADGLDRYWRNAAYTLYMMHHVGNISLLETLYSTTSFHHAEGHCNDKYISKSSR